LFLLSWAARGFAESGTYSQEHSKDSEDRIERKIDEIRRRLDEVWSSPSR
jgi:hypothetical protein